MLNVPTLMLCLLSMCIPAAMADDIRIAVAASFTPTLKRLATDFTASTGHRIVISSASTGKHYAQIRNGARFDLFLAADSERPERLEREGSGVPGSRFVYAQGRLALWVPNVTVIDDPRALLAGDLLPRLAIANPRLAPYGRAAREVLTAWGLWHMIQNRLVRGENAGQAFQFVATGNAPAGLVALSQVREYDKLGRGSYRVIDAEYHAPICQQVLLLRQTPASEAFLAFLKSGPASAVIRAAGYALPADA